MTSRAKFLGEQMQYHMGDLATGATPSTAILFLNLFARLDAFPDEELEKEGLLNMVTHSREAVAIHASDLGRIAEAGLSYTNFLEAAFDNPCNWLRDFLMIATISPWLPDQEKVNAALDRATATVEAFPEMYMEDGACLVKDRKTFEHPEGLCPRVQELFKLLHDELPILVCFDKVSR